MGDGFGDGDACDGGEDGWECVVVGGECGRQLGGWDDFDVETGFVRGVVSGGDDEWLAGCAGAEHRGFGCWDADCVGRRFAFFDLGEHSERSGDRVGGRFEDGDPFDGGDGNVDGEYVVGGECSVADGDGDAFWFTDDDGGEHGGVGGGDGVVWVWVAVWDADCVGG